MTILTMKTNDNSDTTLSADAVAEFAGSLRGTLTVPRDSDYDDVRAVWNGMIDKRPGMIARCAGTADVMAAVAFARQHNLLVAIRGAGHNIAGSALCDGGLVIDLSGMRAVHVDPAAKTADVQPGATLGDLDHETQPFGLAVPVGINSTTGVAGLTLGGGFGWLTRAYGMTIDNLLSADVVTAKGELVRASANENPDLFWALRGGGGNFGIVTSFEFQLRPVGPEVLAGLVVYDRANAKALLQQYRELAAAAPDELSVWVVLRKAPPLPFLPEAAHGTDVMVLATVYTGDIAAGEKALAPFRALEKPLGEHVGPSPFAGFQQAFDPLLTPGARNYWKTHNFGELSDDAIDVLLEHAGKMVSDESEVFMAQMGGATRLVADDATAYTGRDAAFVMNVHGRWQNADDDDRCVAWARELFRATAPFASGGAYVNFMTGEEQDRVQQAYGASYERLVEVKRRYDPDNMFRTNQNIRP